MAGVKVGKMVLEKWGTTLLSLQSKANNRKGDGWVLLLLRMKYENK